MKYTLSELLKDKKLRSTLTKAPMTFADGNGVFELDFATQSLKVKCQRIVFDKLYALGGEDLFKKLLEEGSTNLTSAPNASNAGMVAVAGAKGWYLKTNVGESSALASILFGIAGWAEMSGEFDGELVSISDSSEEPEAEAEPEEPAVEAAAEPAEEAACDEEDEDAEEPFDGWRSCITKELLGEALPLAAYSRGSKNDRHVFYDDEKKQFVSFTVGQLEIEEMLECEPLVYNSYYGGWDGEECDDYSPNTIFGYKYRLEKDGKWGFISAGFTRVLAPQFDDLKVVNSRFNKDLLAWTFEDEYLRLWDALPVERTGGELDWWLQPVKSSDGLTEDERYYFPKEKVPAEDAYYESHWDEEDKSIYRLYFPSVKQGHGYYWNEDIGDTWVEQMTCQDGILTVGMGKDQYRIPYVGQLDLFTIQVALQAAWKNPDGFELIFPLESQENSSGMERLAVIRREGYLAVARLAPNHGGSLCNYPEDMLTPFAFTKIDAENAWENQVVVDLFGKKGIFDYKKREYVIPCDYEQINKVYGGYSVKKAGFEGKIKVDGTWETTLHR